MSQKSASSGRRDLLNSPIGNTLKSMTLPMLVGMVMMMSFGLVDTYFIGLLGTDELAAISFTFPVTFTLISLHIGLGIGTSAVIGRFLGNNSHSEAQLSGTGALMLAFVLAAVLAFVGVITIDPIFTLLGANERLLSYIHEYMVVWYAAGVFLAMPMVGNSILRASGDTKTPSYVMAGGGLINVILDPILIFGWGPIPAMGMQGAALATLIAWALGLLYILYLLAYKRELILPRLLSMSELKRSSGGILKIGLPAAGANMLTPIAGGILTAVVAGYGPGAVAAWGVGGRLESIASIVILALSMSLPPFISQNFGANNLSRVSKAYQLCVRFVVIWQLLVFGAFYVLSGVLARTFSTEPEVIGLIQTYLMIVPLGYGVQGIVILTNSSFNAMHLPMSALLMSVLRLFVFFVPISYLGSYLFDLKGMFWAGIVANMLTAAVAYIWFCRSLSKRMAT
ncbi:MATE family efflux transporter [Paraglaciecola chathamensis]|uniref:MATE family efflux transporter n=3 Tax=Paraglaciecola chathamensis TaxID=368405 RepID=A0A8H9IBI9_9ALTE|nr:MULTISPECIES: MATE family efflux transporter [Paraglaciecola]AEE22321.1 MATE efflux family protein [Glaciecola sp. 4H-3-7+YE-5]GAC05386.1 MATE efflux family protein [Paraglaciecola agarilytica NO2]GAC11220.1 MATE efflux family protein [Paraglaciecola chathamensis S18K6]GGZ55737.1 MATE family efflux transporter [Paraglaciecola oceanifecundans]